MWLTVTYICGPLAMDTLHIGVNHTQRDFRAIALQKLIRALLIMLVTALFRTLSVIQSIIHNNLYYSVLPGSEMRMCNPHSPLHFYNSNCMTSDSCWSWYSTWKMFRQSLNTNMVGSVIFSQGVWMKIETAYLCNSCIILWMMIVD